MKSAVFIDASNLMHRALRIPFAWNSVKNDPNSNAAVYLFVNIFHKLYKDNEGRDLFFVLDGSPIQKKSEYSQYKGNRQKLDNIYYQQMNKMKSILTNFPIKTAYCKDREADDIIYYLCKNLNSKYHEIFIISNDKDFIQLKQQFNNIKIYDPINNCFRELPDKLTGKFTDYKALTGDPSDNIIKILSESKAFKAANGIDKWKSLASDAQLKQYIQNITLIDFTLLDFSGLEIENTEYTFNKENIKTLFEEYKFNSILKKFNEWSHVFEPSIFNSLF